MTQAELLALHESLCGSARAFYGADNDPFSNFRATGILGIAPALGILVRMLDKIARVQSFIERGELAVKNEPVQDALIDIINYAVLLAGLIEESHGRTDMLGHDAGTVECGRTASLDYHDAGYRRVGNELVKQWPALEECQFLGDCYGAARHFE